MKDHSSTDSSEIRRKLSLALVSGIILIAVGKILTDYGDSAWLSLASILVRDVGVALVVAFIVGIVIEMSMRKKADQVHKEHLKEVETNIFRSAFGISIQPTILEELYATVFAIGFMRRNLKVSHEFVLPVDATLRDEKLIDLTTTIEYELVNMSNRTAPAKIEHYFEDLIDKESYSSKYIALCVSTPNGTKVLDLEDNAKEMVKENTKDSAKLRCNDMHPKCNDGLRKFLEVGPTALPIEPSQFLKVQYVRKTLKRERDLEIYVTTISADGIFMEAIVDPALSHLIFYPDASHSKTPFKLPQLTPDIHQWRIKAGVLPSQGIILFWKPKTSTDTTHSQNMEIPPCRV